MAIPRHVKPTGSPAQGTGSAPHAAGTGCWPLLGGAAPYWDDRLLLRSEQLANRTSADQHFGALTSGTFEALPLAIGQSGKVTNAREEWHYGGRYYLPTLASTPDSMDLELDVVGDPSDAQALSCWHRAPTSRKT